MKSDTDSRSFAGLIFRANLPADLLSVLANHLRLGLREALRIYQFSS